MRHDTTLTRVGRFGISERIPLPADVHNADLTTSLFLLTAPTFHPAWSQYLLLVVDLTNAGHGAPAPRLDFAGATHELVVHAINPANGLLSPTTLIERLRQRDPSVCLSPANVVHQFTGTDDELAAVAYACGHAVVRGYLNPEAGDAPAVIREQWLQTCVLTLAHLRGEEHAGHGH